MSSRRSPHDLSGGKQDRSVSCRLLSYEDMHNMIQRELRPLLERIAELERRLNEREGDHR
jgi:hypothetical protein